MTTPRTVRVDDFRGLRAWLEPRLASVECVSFDVFDTLLFRCIEPPGELHRRVATLLAAEIGHRTTDQVLAARQRVEQRLRRAAVRDGQDHECHFDPLVEGWVRELVGHTDERLVEFVHRVELELEGCALDAKPEALATLDWLHARDVRCIAVSDMYLSHDHIAELLRQSGIDGYLDRLYVSSEFGLAKYSGRLHARVLEEEGLAPGQMVHVGDNRVSDLWAPLQQGIQGVFLNERAERRRRRRQAVSAQMARLGGPWRGRRFFEVVDLRMQHDARYREQAGDFFYHYGANVLGPAFATFMLGVIERCQRHRPDKVYFLARDGHLFERMYRRWQALDTEEGTLPEPVYIYASRRVVACASVADGLTREQARMAFFNPKQQGLLSVLRTFGLPPEAFQEAARRHGFERLDQKIRDREDPRLMAFLEDDAVQARVAEYGQAARERMERYFEQVGFFDCQTAALVDIGWNGTIQKFLRSSFGHRDDYPGVLGWYFAFAAAIHGSLADTEGLMMDARNGRPCDRAPLDFEEIFEQGARATEATTLGYAEEGGRIVPVLKPDDAPDRQAEIACNPIIEAIQAGVLKQLDHFHAAWRLTGYSHNDLKPYARGLVERAVVYPDREEVREIGRLVHTEDFGHDNTLDISGIRLGLADLFRPGRAFQRLREQAWRFGVHGPLPPLFTGFILRMAQLRQIRQLRKGKRR